MQQIPHMPFFRKQISADPAVQTAEGRINDLRALAQDFNTHLMTVPGSILPPNLRLGVAICARDALLKCKTCHEDVIDRRSSMACPLPNARFYSIFDGWRHEPGFPTDGNNDNEINLSVNTEKCLTTIIHTLICHQDRIDQLFYEDAVAALMSCGILDEYADSFKADTGRPMEKEDAELAARAVYCEIIVLAAISQALHLTFLSLGDGEVPALPSWDKMKGAPQPSNIRYRDLLKQVRYDKAFAFSPFFVSSDIIRDSSEYSKIRAGTWTKLPYVPLPYRCAIFAIEDFVFFRSVQATLYLALKDVLLSWGALGPSRCPTVCRRDVEAVAGATAKAHRCTY